MEINDLIKVIEEETQAANIGKVNATTVFKQLFGWSSMTALILVARIDADYNLQIDAADLHSAVTVEDLFNALKSKN